MKNVSFNLNEIEKNRILNLHEAHKLKTLGLLNEDPDPVVTTNEYLNEPRLGDPFDYLKVGDDKPTYYFKIASNPTGNYKQPIKNATYKTKWDDYSAKYPNWTPATGKNVTSIQSNVKFQTTPVAGGVLNPKPVVDKTITSPPSTASVDKAPIRNANQVTSDKQIDPNADIQRGLDYKTRKDGQINTKDAAKQIDQQDKAGQKALQQMENKIVESCLVHVKNIEKSFFGRGLLNRQMTPEKIDELLKQNTVKEELKKNLTELFKPLFLLLGTLPFKSGKRCIDYDKVKQQIDRFPNFKPEELAKKVGLDINNLENTPKKIEANNAVIQQYNTSSKGTSTGGSGMGAMEKSGAEFDAMINKSTETKAPVNTNPSNNVGPINNPNNQSTNADDQKRADYLKSQISLQNNSNVNTNTNYPDDDGNDQFGLAKNKR